MAYIYKYKTAYASKSVCSQKFMREQNRKTVENSRVPYRIGVI